MIVMTFTAVSIKFKSFFMSWHSLSLLLNFHRNLLPSSQRQKMEAAGSSNNCYLPTKLHVITCQKTLILHNNMDRFTPCLFSYANIIIQELYNERPPTYNLGQLSVLMQAGQPEPQDKSSCIINLKLKC